ncbi:UDP-N-acetylmuramate--L-alanine ligase [Rothia sp. P13129]|uniref:UDP-N-acetylmuramate--L-alanine ligase n=1 Tax=Rothia sp. P13129 TaxID=3402664 RepID=UPI003AC7A620
MTNNLMNLQLDLPHPLTPPFPERLSLDSLGKVHFVGIGGAGMSAIARLMVQAGVSVSGSDRAESSVTDSLRELGIEIFTPQAAENVVNVDTVVVSTAIMADNPELVKARELGLRVLHRSEALAATMGTSEVVAVAGTHGKTTTSSMISVTLGALGADPSFAVGSTIAGYGTNAHLSSNQQGSWFVAEADESDGSFVRYRPQIAVVTNVEPDHIDFYGTADKVYEAFARFVASMPEDGVLIACIDDAGARDLASCTREAGYSVITYGEAEDAHVRLSETTSDGIVCSSHVTWDFMVGEQNVQGAGQLVLNVPGKHNQLNGLAAFICGVLAGYEAESSLKAVTQFQGTDRRFTLRGVVNDIRVFDDYAHHPTEVFRALEAGRTVAAGHNLYVLFQPHLFSRTQEFAQEFAQALSTADRSYVLDIYPARELPIEGVTSALITEAGFSEVHYAQPEEALEKMISQARPGDVIMTVGAGDVTAYGSELVERLSKRAKV